MPGLALLEINDFGRFLHCAHEPFHKKLWDPYRVQEAFDRSVPDPDGLDVSQTHVLIEGPWQWQTPEPVLEQLESACTIACNRSIPRLAEDLTLIRPTLMISVPRIFERIDEPRLPLQGGDAALRGALKRLTTPPGML